MHKKLLEEMKKRKSEKDLMCLADIVDMCLDTMKESDHEFYEHLERKMYEMLYGRKLNEEMAKEIVEDMQPNGEHWSIEQTNSVLQSKGWQLDKVDFYIVMNSAYNDYHELFEEDVDKYAMYSKLFIKDTDAKEGKVYNYFMNIPK